MCALLALPAPAIANETLEMRLLARHNLERARVGVPELAWDARLAKNATLWARKLAATARFDHAPESAGEPEGENLWMGTADAYSPEDMVDGWIEERQNYREGRFPHVTRTANWSDVGHYTQLIWRNTERVGCAIAKGGGSDFLVCRYAPAGNWAGEDPKGRDTRQMAAR